MVSLSSGNLISSILIGFVNFGKYVADVHWRENMKTKKKTCGLEMKINVDCNGIIKIKIESKKGIGYHTPLFPMERFTDLQRK